MDMTSGRSCRFSELATPSKDAEDKMILRIESGDVSVLGQRWCQVLDP